MAHGQMEMARDGSLVTEGRVSFWAGITEVHGFWIWLKLSRPRLNPLLVARKTQVSGGLKLFQLAAAKEEFAALTGILADACAENSAGGTI
jgi:hypothetical protein